MSVINLVTLKFLIVTPIDISQDILGLKKIDKPNESVKIKKCVKGFVAPFKEKMSTKVFFFFLNPKITINFCYYYRGRSKGVPD